MKKLNIDIGSVFLAIILAVLLLSVGGWANCWYASDLSRDDVCNAGGNAVCSLDNTTSICYSTRYSGLCSMTQCGSSSNQFKDIQGGTTNFLFDCDFYGYGKIHGTVCDKCGADSLVCVNDGNSWQTDQSASCGKSCKISNCKAADSTWLTTSIASCTGSNNYAIVNTDSTCEHVGTCCPNDSIPSGNTCKWRCDSLYTACTAKNGYLYAGVLQDTTISGSDSTFTNKCYYNCSYAYNKDSTTSVTDGNAACSSPSTPIADCTRMPNDFSSVRTTYGDSVYSYDFLTPGSAAYIDSIVLTPCSRFMYRCTINGKYKYWYSDADIPAGCTNIVKIK